ncbi:DUF5320 domain-containing protein [Desulfobacca acetoxidans]|uniref:DUF5320 domain-containing protein n=1 Tax=Desulfobacca acetoxidans (strain ATCC 700848 / DSM 11109 / ASRB2) TaxID=880072 RepID=F2NHV2_DESAR|nr:DUF5320 domain-containing protein [Desulfobacca acetoxidans]AEB09437.1 hypothetical protein Desac_1584 [Desulfobacca acetoxidans DSM 11109]HAY23243.1 hypothetical protein [Desulfobacterales bacterium]
MPGFDGTGPRGQGPGTGWGMGPCGTGFRRGYGGGFGRGFRGSRSRWGGWGRPRWGWGAWEGGYATPESEAQALKQEESYLQSELEAIKRRLSEIEGA